ncbi:adenylate/guanylate cyclase domain-containing protein [Gammaproteobacteria bacterium]|nr:adenylate/guanylate cyclase domain-containing protein [Gammaproteobacteria bacterium]
MSSGRNIRFIGALIDGASDMGFQLSLPVTRVFVVLLSLGLAGILYSTFWSSFQVLEERFGSLGWTLSPTLQPEERIVIVAIDERSISEVGPWPWPRQTMAQLVSAIDESGAQLQLYDIAFPDSKPGDSELSGAFSASGRAVISQIPILPENSIERQSVQSMSVGVMTHPLTGVSCSDSAASEVGFPVANGYIASSASFAGVLKGHITPIVNADGTISRQPAAVCVDGLPYPALALAALQQASLLGGPSKAGVSATVDRDGGFWDPAQSLTLDNYPGLAIPLDRQGALRVSYSSHPASYQAVSATDILNGSEDAALLEGAWVLVGATAFGLDDVVPTPYSGAAPGVELQARILASILDAEVPYTPRAAGWLLGFLCLGFALVLVRVADLSGRVAAIFLPALIILFPVTSWALHAQMLHSASIWLGWAFPALFGFISGGFVLLFEQARVRLQRNRVLGNLESYLPRDVARQIAYSLPSSDIQASRTDVTLLSGDLRNFSAYSEARPAEESAAVLHFFFQSATQIVEKYNGRIHEFNGDSLLAIWDDHGSESAKRAHAAGVHMIERINEQLLERYAPEGLEPLALGVGIEQGPALIGSIGPSHRRAHVLLGDTVTIALRIQEMTADLAQPILFGECAARQLHDVKLQSQGSYLLAGLKNPHTLYAPAPSGLSLEVRRSGADKSKFKVLSGGRR